MVATANVDKRPGLGIAATTAAVVIWGATSVVVKGIDGIDGVGIAWYRLLMGAALLAAVQLVRGGRIDRRLLRLCLPGGIAFALDLLLFFTALRETSVANATVIGALQPILLLPIGVRLFGERVARATVLWSVVSVVGTSIVVLGATGLPTWSAGGDLLAVGALVTWTAYFIFSKQVREHLGAIEYFCGLTIVAAVIVTPYALLSGTDLSPAGPMDWGAIVGITVFSGAIGHVLLNWSHPHVPLQTMSLLTLLVPVVATGGSVLFLDEDIARLQLVGMAIVLVALASVVARQSSAGD